MVHYVQHSVQPNILIRESLENVTVVVPQPPPSLVHAHIGTEHMEELQNL